MMLLINMKENFLTNTQMMKKHEAKLQQPWIAEIGLRLNSYVELVSS